MGTGLRACEKVADWLDRRGVSFTCCFAGVTRFVVIAGIGPLRAANHYHWVRALARIDLNSGQRQVLTRMTAGGCSLLVDVEREPPGSVGRETELSNGAWGNALFDVITVKMQDKGLVACPPQFHDIAFGDADEPHCVGDAAALDLDVKGKLGRGGADTANDDQQQGQRHFAGTKGDTALAFFIDRDSLEHQQCD